MEARTLNSSGAGDIGKNFGILKNTVIAGLKKIPAEVNPHVMPQADSIEIEIKTDAEADAFWSCAGGRKIRGGHAAKRKTGAMLAWPTEGMPDESCSRLTAKLSAFPAVRYYSGDWQSCQKAFILGAYCRKS